jgi:phosphopantothenoylcysteine decarboxylase/phosphopantothenate--cysteine ligase
VTLAGKRIVVGVGGGIAAFKAVEVVRELQRRGAKVRVMMTRSAGEFIGALTFAGITGEPAVSELFDPRYPGEVHVELGGWAEAIVIAPATANLIARAAAGMADDVVLATLSCAACPVFFAPAMHTRMWLHPATRRNFETVTRDGARILGPVVGALASGEQGPGRMCEPVEIVDALERYLVGTKDLRGLKLLVTAGPTVEDVDPVRFLGNRSTGKMGFAIAERAAARGARVILVAGPSPLTPPRDAEVIAVRSALEMRQAVLARFGDAHAVIMAAAVADYRPAEPAAEKIKKSGEKVQLELVKNPDILAELGVARTERRPVLVGFAVETGDLIGYARKKLVEKKCDLIVANAAHQAFGGDQNQATFVDLEGAEELPQMHKSELADRILDRVLGFLQITNDPRPRLVSSPPPEPKN